MNREEAHKLIDSLFNEHEQASIVTFAPPAAVKPERTDGKRAVRTKSTGDRVYLIDDNAKTKAWITSPEILSKLGFEMADVQDLDDKELIEYRMAPSVFKVND